MRARPMAPVMPRQAAVGGAVVWHLDAVCFRHPGASTYALSEVSLEIPAGRVTAIIGPNGAGKSTLLHLLLGVAVPNAGRVTLFGTPAHSWRRVDMARTVAVVPQAEAEPLFTVRDTVAMGRYPHRAAWQRETAADTQAIVEAMAQCGVQPFADRAVGSLSGGERQRVRLARALAQQTEIVVLDEPTSALDIRYEMAVFEQVAALRATGRTAVLVTHQLNLASRYADQLVLLHAGRIVAQGAPRDVLVAPRVESVYEWPVDVIAHREGAPQIVPERRPMRLEVK